jgi:polyisoprenoid-binding protein YceI
LSRFKENIKYAMKKIGILLLVSISAFGQSRIDFDEFYPIDKGHSYIEFSITYMGYAKVKGRFSDFSGLVRYDPNNSDKLSATIGIRTESIDTDNDFRDQDLKSDNWFDSEKFPLITFSSKKSRKSKGGFELTGDITIKAVTKEIVLRIERPSGVLKDARKDYQVIFTGSAKLDRTEFGVEGKNWSAVKEGITAVANEVTIEFSILGKQVKVSNYSNRFKNDQSPHAKVYWIMKEQGIEQGLVAFRSMSESPEPMDRNVLSMVGMMFSLEGKIQDAVSVYEANREAFPEQPEVYYDLGQAYGLLGDLGKSKSNFQQAIRLNPQFFWAVEMLRHF